MPTSTIISSTAKTLTVTVDTVNTLTASAKTVFPLFSWFDNLPGIIRAILGSLIAAAILFILTKICNLTVNLIKKMKIENDKEKVALHVLYKNFITQDDTNNSSRGLLFVIWKAFQKVLDAILMSLYLFFLYFLLDKNYYAVIFTVLIFSYFLDARKWLKDHSDKKYLKGLDKDVYKKFEEDWGKNEEKK